MTDNQLTTDELATILQAYEVCGRELAGMGASDRRRVCGAMVQGLAKASPVAIADIAAAAALTVLSVGGAK